MHAMLVRPPRFEDAARHKRRKPGCLGSFLYLLKGFLPGSAMAVDDKRLRDSLIEMSPGGNPGLTGRTLKPDTGYRTGEDIRTEGKKSIPLIDQGTGQPIRRAEQQPAKPEAMQVIPEAQPVGLGYLGVRPATPQRPPVLLDGTPADQQPEGQDGVQQEAEQRGAQPGRAEPARRVLLGEPEQTGDIPIATKAAAPVDTLAAVDLTNCSVRRTPDLEATRQTMFKIRIGHGKSARTVTKIETIRIFGIYNPFQLLFSILPRTVLFPLGFWLKPFVAKATIYPANALIVFTLSNGRKAVRIAGVVDSDGYMQKIRSGKNRKRAIVEIKQIAPTEPLCMLIEANDLDHGVPKYDNAQILKEKKELEAIGLRYLVRAKAENHTNLPPLRTS